MTTSTKQQLTRFKYPWIIKHTKLKRLLKKLARYPLLKKYCCSISLKRLQSENQKSGKKINYYINSKRYF